MQKWKTWMEKENTPVLTIYQNMQRESIVCAALLPFLTTVRRCASGRGHLCCELAWLLGNPQQRDLAPTRNETSRSLCTWISPHASRTRSSASKSAKQIFSRNSNSIHGALHLLVICSLYMNADGNHGMRVDILLLY